MDELEARKKEFGLRVKKCREAIGISQDELAKRLNYKHRSAIQKIESGQNSIPQDKIKMFADALEVSVAYFMGWEQDKNITATISDGNDLSVAISKANEDQIEAIKRILQMDEAGIRSFLNRSKSL